MEKIKRALIGLGKRLVTQIKKKENPTIALPTRALSNVNFNQKTKTLELGQNMTSRQFFNTAHSKKLP